MGCCHARRLGSESDADGACAEELILFEQLDQQDALTASSAESADEPLPCTAMLRERVMVFRAGMRHGITADVDQFAVDAKAQDPELQPRDQRRMGQWIDDVLRHTAASADELQCPVSVADEQRATRGGRRRHRPRYTPGASATEYPAGRYAAATAAAASAGGDGAAQPSTHQAGESGDMSAPATPCAGPSPTPPSPGSGVLSGATHQLQQKSPALWKYAELAARHAAACKAGADLNVSPHASHTSAPGEPRPNPPLAAMPPAGLDGRSWGGSAVANAHGVFVPSSSESDSDFAHAMQRRHRGPGSDQPRHHRNPSSSQPHAYGAAAGPGVSHDPQAAPGPSGALAYVSGSTSGAPYAQKPLPPEQPGFAQPSGVPPVRAQACRIPDQPAALHAQHPTQAAGGSPHHQQQQQQPQPQQSYARQVLMQRVGGIAGNRRGRRQAPMQRRGAQTVSEQQQLALSYSESSDAEDFAGSDGALVSGGIAGVQMGASGRRRR